MTSFDFAVVIALSISRSASDPSDTGIMPAVSTPAPDSSGDVDAVVTKQTAFDITIGDRDVGQILIGLFGDIVPKTVENFYEICTGDNSKKYTYTGSIFHRIIKDFMIQGGDVVNFNGTGSWSIYNDTDFPDENFKLNHYGAGWVSMANAGPNTNGCQFYIAANANKTQDGRFVVFGKVLKGMDVFHQVENVETNLTDSRPLQNVTIKKCSAVPVDKPFSVPKTDATE